MGNILKVLKTIFYIIFFAPMVIGLLMIATGNGTSSKDSEGYHSSRPYNRYQNNLRREREQAQKRLKAEQERIRQEEFERYKNMPVVSTPSYHSGSSSSSYTSGSSSRSNYAILWSECEDLESLLDDNDIDHPGLYYPMDYHELQDLRDEYIDLLEEYDIDY